MAPVGLLSSAVRPPAGVWYKAGRADEMWKGRRVRRMLCKGNRPAIDSDFEADAADGSPPESRVFGSFYHRTDRKGTFFNSAASALNPGGYVEDAIEVRSMGGQSSGTAAGGEGNEDTGIAALDIWVHGCPISADAPPVCGNGVVEQNEACDLGDENGWESRCSLAWPVPARTPHN